MVGSQIGSNGLAGSFYPPAAHSTGVGWALGIGRFGGVIGPLLGGWLLSQKLPTDWVFLLGAIPSVCAAAAIVAMGLLARPGRQAH